MVLKHTVRWDAIFYLEIAMYGYNYEKNHAFFPFFPKLLELMSQPLEDIQLWIIYLFNTKLYLIYKK